MSGRVLSAKEIAEILTPQKAGRFGLILDERVNLVVTLLAYQAVVVAAKIEHGPGAYSCNPDCPICVALSALPEEVRP